MAVPDVVVGHVDCLLLDIEGTTTSISFVKDKLFPYVRRHLHDYVIRNWESSGMKGVVDGLIIQSRNDAKDNIPGVVVIDADLSPTESQKSVIDNVLWQMDNDRKTSALKQLQGIMWQNAYTAGEVLGHVYDDVPKALEFWSNLGKKICIYSSGSVQAQKLLFKHSTAGNLTKYFSTYFDTSVGPKIASESYKSICSNLNLQPGQILFLTDSPLEAHAAKDAGLRVHLVSRPGNAPLSLENTKAFKVIKTFGELM